MSDRKGLADRLEAIADFGWACGDEDALRQAARALRQEPSVDEVARTIAAADGVTWDGYTVTFSHVPGSDDDGPTDRYFRAAQAIHAMYRRGEP